MFYLLASGIDSSESQFLFLFQYVTFRSVGSFFTAFSFMLLSGPAGIRLLRSYQGAGQPIRSDGPQSHIIAKQGTPTMGGLLILSGIHIAVLLWADLRNPYILSVLFIATGYAIIGFYDDYVKVIKCASVGLPGKVKLALEVLLALIVIQVLIFFSPESLNLSIAIPFFDGMMLNLGFLFPFFAMCVIVGSGNGVNLTDGLDGLAIVPVIIAGTSLGLIAYFVGHSLFSDYLGILHIPGAGELSVICGALLGAGLGFLWFNALPAQIFMGDTGSLGLGGLLGTLAVILKHELVFAIIGGIFVLETLSVIIQVACFKLTGKRVFRMAPLHHHFEQKGLSESAIVVRFWIISVILAIIGLSSLKLH
ncbi:MAG: phospho-N-acetylmuramoyl-pentapeptide-transferase [Alphaproteobacteria bacterium]|nr:phospho-N-acetylmuramoyl-pentapeptide-transferase [Alphaproteobacteria bacterium]